MSSNPGVFSTEPPPKSRKKIVIFLGCGIVLLAAAAALAIFLMTPPNYYTSKNFGFKVRIPDGFEIQSNEGVGGEVIIIHPKEQQDNIRNLRNLYLIYVSKTPGEDVSLYSESQLALEFRKSAPNQKFIPADIKKVKYKGLSCAELTTQIEEGLDEPGYMLWCNKGGNGYQLSTMNYPRAEFDKLLDLFEFN